MAYFDLPLSELTCYKPAREEPQDFDQFWQLTLSKTRELQQETRYIRVEHGLKFVDIFDVTFSGYMGQPVKAWLVLPRQLDQNIPCVVEYVGYGGGRGFGFDFLLWANMGYAHFIMDTRGQGSAWSTGDTPDVPENGSNPFFPGFMTQGILDPLTYYYRRVFSDAVRAVDVVRAHPAIDPAKIAVTGGSQGGGITLAASGLVPDVQISMPDVPFLCHFRRAITYVDSYPYKEIGEYLKTHRDLCETVYKTLAYFDGVNFAARAKADALYSTGLMDQICPPSTVFAAYNHQNSPKEIKVYDFNGHEGGGAFQTQEKIKFLAQRWG